MKEKKVREPAGVGEKIFQIVNLLLIVAILGTYTYRAYSYKDYFDKLATAQAGEATTLADALLEKARSYGKDKTLCFILGPTSKVLVYHLAREGYMAWDIGHMAKDYDYFCRNTEKTDHQIAEFYAAD